MGFRRHLFHIVNPSPWPLLTSLSIFYFLSGLTFYMHKLTFGGYFSIYGLISFILCLFFWFSDIIDESTNSGYHTIAVRMGLKIGFILFVVSEIMLFFAFFWAFFHSSINPCIEIGSIFPPEGLHLIPVLEFPLFNTLLLINSGISVTWAHRAFSLCSYKEAIDSFLITIFMGFLFLSLQLYEYYEAPFEFSDSVYACSFYMLTGLHGFHVFVGVVFLTVCFIRLLKRHFLSNHYLGFVLAIWYWHFVDVVWIFLFISVYCWGSW